MIVSVLRHSTRSQYKVGGGRTRFKRARFKRWQMAWFGHAKIYTIPILIQDKYRQKESSILRETLIHEMENGLARTYQKIHSTQFRIQDKYRFKRGLLGLISPPSNRTVPRPVRCKGLYDRRRRPSTSTSSRQGTCYDTDILINLQNAPTPIEDKMPV